MNENIFTQFYDLFGNFLKIIFAFVVVIRRYFQNKFRFPYTGTNVRHLRKHQQRHSTHQSKQNLFPLHQRNCHQEEFPRKEILRGIDAPTQLWRKPRSRFHLHLNAIAKLFFWQNNLMSSIIPHHIVGKVKTSLTEYISQYRKNGSVPLQKPFE